MKTIAFFNNRGGVGATTLCFNVAHMLSRMGYRTLAVDLDPQANLTAYFCPSDEVEQLWEETEQLVHIAAVLSHYNDINSPQLLTSMLWQAREQNRLALLPGHVRLGGFEDQLANAWTQILTEDPRLHVRATIAFWQIIQAAARDWNPDVVLVDVGPNLGSITRAALIATDSLVIPLTADVFSMQALHSLGTALARWRERWADVRRANEASPEFADLPVGLMRPAGYVMLQQPVRRNRPVKAYQRWFGRVPGAYREEVLMPQGQDGQYALEGGPIPADPSVDPFCIGEVRHYQSLIPLSQDTNKPMFDLTVGDGAIGGHQAYVQACYDNFRRLAESLADACGITSGSPT